MLPLCIQYHSLIQRCPLSFQSCFRACICIYINSGNLSHYVLPKCSCLVNTILKMGVFSLNNIFRTFSIMIHKDWPHIFLLPHSTLKYHVPNFNVHSDYLRILLTYRLWSVRSGVNPEVLHFKKVSRCCRCCWPKNHTSRNKDVEHGWRCVLEPAWTSSKELSNFQEFCDLIVKHRNHLKIKLHKLTIKCIMLKTDYKYSKITTSYFTINLCSWSYLCLLYLYSGNLYNSMLLCIPSQFHIQSILAAWN